MNEIVVQPIIRFRTLRRVRLSNSREFSEEIANSSLASEMKAPANRLTKMIDTSVGSELPQRKKPRQVFRQKWVVILLDDLKW